MTFTPQPFNDWAHQHQTRIEHVLETLMPASTVEPAKLHLAMRYAVLGGGKRVRALLAYVAANRLPTSNLTTPRLY